MTPENSKRKKRRSLDKKKSSKDSLEHIESNFNKIRPKNRDKTQKIFLSRSTTLSKSSHEIQFPSKWFHGHEERLFDITAEKFLANG